MGSGVFKDGRTGKRDVRTGIYVRAGLLERVSLGQGLLRLFLILLLIPVFSAVKCGSLIEGEDSDAAAGGGGSGSSSSSSSSCTSTGSVTISQTTASYTQSTSFGGPTPRIAQSFQTSANKKVSKIEISMNAATIAPASAVLDLYSGGANPTAGTLLGSSTNTAIQLSPAAYYAWTFSDLIIGTGITYYAVLTHSNDGTTGLTVERQAVDLYSSGSMWNFGGGSWSDSGAEDFTFRITTCD